MLARTGERMPPCGVPVSESFRAPVSVMIPALRNAFTRASTRLSAIRFRTRPIRAWWSIESKEYTTYYWYRGLSVFGDRGAGSTSVSEQGVAGAGPDAPAWFGGVSCGATRRQQDVDSGRLHRRRCGADIACGGDGGGGRGLGAAGVGGGVVAATGGDRDRRCGGRYGRSGQGGPPCT